MSGRFASRLIALSLVAFFLVPGTAASQSNQPFGLHEKAIERIDLSRQISPIKEEGGFGEQVSKFNGSAEFSATDVSIPGNSALPVAVTRKLTIDDRYRKNGTHIGGFGIWDIDLPKISGIYTTASGWYNNRCSAPGAPISVGTFAADDYWSGHSLNIPGAGEQALLMDPSAALLAVADGNTYPWVTKGMWRIRCKPATKNGYPGQAFIAKSPDGIVYHLDWVVTRDHASIQSSYSQHGQLRTAIHFLISRIEDRFGNWVNYTYSGGNLASIEANDGRRIDLVYTSGKVSSIAAHGQTWSYFYGGYNSQQLIRVVNPDGSDWTYAQTGLIEVRPPVYTQPFEDEFADCPDEVEPELGDFSLTVKHPSGAQGKFDFQVMRHYRVLREIFCVKESATYEYLKVPRYSAALTLTKKTITGPNLPALIWNYAYTQPGLPDETKVVEVTGPGNDYERFTFGAVYEETEGQLLSQEKGGSSTSILETTTYSYVSAVQAAGMPFPSAVGVNPFVFADKLGTAWLRPLRTTTIHRSGDTFQSHVGTYDLFARPLAVTKSSSLGHTKQETTAYLDDAAQWLLGLALTSHVNGIEVSKTEYDARRLPWMTHSFGKLKNTLTYHADGTLATVTDGRGNTISLSNWKRGIPRSIQHPSTPEALAGATESATVNDNGWVTSVTDENGYVTGYGYDAMGRLASETYPADTIAWAPKVFEFRPVTAADWLPPGIVVGQWRRYEGQGNYAKFTYFDGLWRPVLVQEYDTGNVTPTLRYSRTAYDSDSRVSFQSYPVSDPATATTGTRTFYDALDRVTLVEQDSEHGVLRATTQYLSGLKTLVTNPRGVPTTTHFMAWDVPSYDLPIRSDHSDNKVIEIVRHLHLGRPEQLRQRSADGSLQQTRSYVYDSHAQLCKTIEPETGATVMHYDPAGNLDWSAAGLSLPNASTCDDTHASIAARKATRQYDPRNRLTHLIFPDGRGNQIWTYEKDNLPASVTAYNDPGNTAAVVTAYTYNKRRLPTGESLSQPGWYTWGIGYNYDPIGNLRWQSYPTGLVLDYAPNALGQSTQARDQFNTAYASGAQYYPNGALKQFTYGNGIAHTMTQNARQLPQRVTSSGGALDFGYTYDNNANITSIWDHARDTGNGFYGRWMFYDGLDRLTAAGSANFGGDHWHRFTYDALDNLKSWKLGGVKDYADYVYNAQNQLTSIRNTAGATVVGLSYDPQGNLQNKNGQTYNFDYGNRLRDVTGKEYYRYDGLGRRVLNGRATTITLSQYSQSGQLMYQQGNTEGASEHIYLAGSLVATRNNGINKYQHTDALGSPVAVTNQTGQVIERNDYEPYGAIIGKPNYNGIGYTGHMMDGATGLTYMQQRYYDQSIGRFLSVDPISADSNSGEMFNRYSYAYNNPYLYSDPDGRKGKIGNAVELVTGGMRIGARVTFAQAVKLRERGLNFLADSHRIARQVEKGAHGKQAYRDTLGPHELLDEARNPIGKKGLPHYQTDGVRGHSFWQPAAAVLVFIGVQLNQQAEAADKVAEVADNFDPYRIGDAGPENECANSCGVSDARLDKSGGIDGFRGVFRVQGRIDSRRLDTQEQKKK